MLKAESYYPISTTIVIDSMKKGMLSVMLLRLFSLSSLSVLLILWNNISIAFVEIDITQGNVEPIPVAIDAFKGHTEGTKALGAQIADVMIGDLQNSGLFRRLNKAAFLEDLALTQTPAFQNWRRINATILVVGHVEDIGNDMLKVDFKIWDPFGEVLVGQGTHKASTKAWRRIAHKIADQIYKKMTGEGPYFDTRVLFIAESGPQDKRIKRLAIMDQDGANIRMLTDGRDLVLTPRFDMKSQKVIYMSYKHVVPKVYILDLNTGIQRLVGDFPGMSFAPRFSPDGNYAIMSVAKYGATNLYEVDLRSGVVNQLTSDRAVINTSPSYSPDGKRITFNSDRGGGRQLYVMNRDGSGIKRISFGGGTYATPVWSPRGDYIAFTKIRGGTFYIGVMRADGSGERLLTTSWLDEGPTWSPNGRVIMFTRQRISGQSSLYAIDVTGYHERLIKTPGDASDPAWSPLLGAN